MEVIDAITYPDASFASTHVSQQGDTVAVAGTLTFHGVTKEIISTGTGKWSDGRLVVLENFNISMTSYGIDRPSLLMIPVQDTIRFTLQATFRVQ
jgi:polyisoprenoid-binding protein YceI